MDNASLPGARAKMSSPSMTIFGVSLSSRVTRVSRNAAELGSTQSGQPGPPGRLMKPGEEQKESFRLKARIQTNRDNRRSRVALMLLVLVAYVSLISTTHHHGQVGRPASESSISSGEHRNSSGAPASTDSSHCATCRLQRSFDSALRSSISPDLCARSLSYETCQREPNLLGASVVFSSRGPPLI